MLASHRMQLLVFVLLNWIVLDPGGGLPFFYFAR